VRAFFEKRKAENDEYFQNMELGEWPDNPSPSNELTGHMAIGGKRPLKVVAICKIPTSRSWEVPAYLCLGGWNECPAPEVNVALFQYWHEQYGGDIATVMGDVIECTVTRPPMDKESALALARKQFAYCTDIVVQGTETLSALAACLQSAKIWFFWWD
jgi:hypothetical protein